MMYTTKAKLKYAKALKKRATMAEKVAKPYLRVIGYRFQMYDPTGYLPDFYSPVFRVAVELDGSVHERKSQRLKDKHKDQARAEHGVYTIRAGNKYALYVPWLLMIEALITGVIYRTYRIMRQCF